MNVKLALRYNMRSKIKNSFIIIINLFVIVLLSIYMKNLDINQSQLNSLPDAIPVNAYITNLNGSQKINLDIKDNLIQGLENSEFITDLQVTVRLKAGVGEFLEEEWQKHLQLWILGTNSLHIFSETNQKSIVWKDGESEKFLKEGDSKCIVSKKLIDKYKWSLGDKISLCQYYYEHGNSIDVYLKRLETADYEVVGYMKELVQDSEVQTLDVILPYKQIKKSFLRQNIPFNADSVSFKLADPLRLNEFKKEMKQLGLVSVAPLADFSFDGCALNVNDSVFITAATRLNQIIDTFKDFLPYVLLLIVGVGYVASLLSLQSKKMDIAMLRILGISRKKCFVILFTECFLLAGCGILVGGIMAIAIIKTDIIVVAFTSITVLACYMCGSSFALWRLQRLSIMEMLAYVG